MQVDVDTERDESWRATAACRGMDPALWYPEKSPGRPRNGDTVEDNHGRAAKAVCAVCPVAASCLESALRAREPFGIFGGASERRRRTLHSVFLRRRHDFSPSCSSPSCEWCPRVREHLSRLSGESVGPVDINGDGARHGRRSTYARGCRCGPCTFAASAVGTRFDYAGWDVPDWWSETFGENAGPELVDIAKWYASALLGLADPAAA